jgi:predicted amidohydrolase YtcJ
VAMPVLALLTLLHISVATAFGASGPADVVLYNGKIYTADPSRSVRQAIAFTGNTIVAVGTDAEVASLIGPGTVVIDLKGKLVLPGLIDAHIHPIIGAVNGSKCSLARINATVEAIRPVLQACTQKRPGGPKAGSRHCGRSPSIQRMPKACIPNGSGSSCPVWVAVSPPRNCASCRPWDGRPPWC